MEGYHKSVLLKEVIESLKVRKDKWYLDATLGDGGHTVEILRLGGRVFGVDVDPQALLRVKARLDEQQVGTDRYRLIQGNYRDIQNLINKFESSSFKESFQASLINQQTDMSDQKFAGAIFDLGVSSLQLETPERGFSFSKVGPLDMRMDPTLDVLALDLINAGGRKELNAIFKNLGEEKYSWRLADAIVSAREIKPYETTLELAQVIEKAIGRSGKIHPATKVFQALRIAVNDELGALKEGLEGVKGLIEKNGYVVVISFHSLEDRIVKDTFNEWANFGFGEVVVKKPIIPSELEIKTNSRSRSAKMRVFRVG